MAQEQTHCPASCHMLVGYTRGCPLCDTPGCTQVSLQIQTGRDTGAWDWQVTCVMPSGISQPTPHPTVFVIWEF